MATQSTEDKPENPGAISQILFWFLFLCFSSVAEKFKFRLKRRTI